MNLRATGSRVVIWSKPASSGLAAAAGIFCVLVMNPMVHGTRELVSSKVWLLHYCDCTLL
jgi:hypothetical protein